MSVTVSNDCNFHFRWKQSSEVGFIVHSFFSPPSLLCHPVVVEATAVRILSGVAIIYDLVLCPDCEKRLIKYLYLPLHLLALFFTRLWITEPVNATAACCWGQLQGCSRGPGFQGAHLRELDFRGHPGMEERILPSSERNCLVTKVYMRGSTAACTHVSTVADVSSCISNCQNGGKKENIRTDRFLNATTKLYLTATIIIVFLIFEIPIWKTWLVYSLWGWSFKLEIIIIAVIKWREYSRPM